MFEHKLTVRNKSEADLITAVEFGSKLLKKLLGVNVHVRVERMNGWGSADAVHAGCYTQYDSKGRRLEVPLVKINMRNLYGASLEQVLQVLGHEFRHAEQHQKGIMDKVPNTDFSHMPFGSKFANYLNQGAEKDARKYQSAYAQLIIEHEDFPCKNSLESRVEGDAPGVVDYAATLAKYNTTHDEISLFSFRGDNKTYYYKLSQLPAAVRGKAKKWSRKLVNKVFEEYSEQLKVQVFEYEYRPLTIYDLVS